MIDRAHDEDDRADLCGKERAAGGANVILGAVAMRALGFCAPSDAIEKVVRYGRRVDRVIGVVADTRFRSSREAWLAVRRGLAGLDKRIAVSPLVFDGAGLVVARRPR